MVVREPAEGWKYPARSVSSLLLIMTMSTNDVNNTIRARGRPIS